MTLVRDIDSMPTVSDSLEAVDRFRSPLPQYRRHSAIAILAMALLDLAGGNGWIAAADTVDGLELPSGADSIVLELAYRDAIDRRPETVVAVYADGSVVVPAADGTGETRGRLTRAQMSNLLHEIVTESSLLELESEPIMREVREAADRSGREWRVSDAAEMVVRVRLKNHSHEIRCPSVEIWHERFPDVESLAQLCIVRRRLENVRAIVQVGGWEQAAGLSEVANQELLRAFPDATPVNASNLTMVRGRASGMRYVQFVTAAAAANREPLMISVFEFPNQPARVRIAPFSGS